jgi:hypothetical protein
MPTTATTIINNGASLQITIGTLIRNVIKSQIVEVEVIKTNIILIDIGKGALGNIFIPYADVTSPAAASPDLLRDAITNLLAPSGGGGTVGGATEAKQDSEIALITTLNTAIAAMNTVISTIDSKIFYDPLLVDNSGTGVIYKGYAILGTAQEAKTWAILRIQTINRVDIYNWAGGAKTFVNSWLDRETLTYL